MADKGNVGAKVALKLLDDPSKLLSTVQIGITAIGVIAGLGVVSYVLALEAMVARLRKAKVSGSA